MMTSCLMLMLAAQWSGPTLDATQTVELRRELASVLNAPGGAAWLLDTTLSLAVDAPLPDGTQTLELTPAARERLGGLRDLSLQQRCDAAFARAVARGVLDATADQADFCAQYTRRQRERGRLP